MAPEAKADGSTAQPISKDQGLGPPVQNRADLPDEVVTGQPDDPEGGQPAEGSGADQQTVEDARQKLNDPERYSKYSPEELLRLREIVEEGGEQDNVERAAQAADDADQDFEDPETIRRTIDNGLGQEMPEEQRQALSGAAHEMGLNQSDIGQMLEGAKIAQREGSIYDDPQEAVNHAFRADPQLQALDDQQRKQVVEAVTQAVQQSPQAQALADQVDLDRNPAVHAILFRKAARMLQRSGKL